MSRTGCGGCRDRAASGDRARARLRQSRVSGCCRQDACRVRRVLRRGSLEERIACAYVSTRLGNHETIQVFNSIAAMQHRQTSIATQIAFRVTRRAPPGSLGKAETCRRIMLRARVPTRGGAMRRETLDMSAIAERYAARVAAGAI